MTLDQLHYFLTTAAHEHIGKASKILRLSPSTISQAITNLEEEFGYSLFEKNGKRIVLTQAGKTFAIHAKELLDHATSLKEQFSKNIFDFQGKFSFAATHVLCHEVMVPAWINLQRQFPRVTSEIFSLRSSQVMEGVLSGNCDAGLCFSPLENSRLEIIKLYEGTMFPAVNCQHPLLNEAADQVVKKLADYPHAAPKSFQGITVCETYPALKRYNIEEDPLFLYDSYDVGAKIINETNSWSLIPDWVISRYKGAILPLKMTSDWEAAFNICLILDKRRHQSRIINELLVHLRRQLQR